MKSFFRDVSLSSITAGFIAVMVGFASSAVIVFQAATAAGASPDEIGSWMLCLGIGSGVATIGLSLYYRMPILGAWSTPGAALLATSITHQSLSQVIGAFIFSSLLLLFFGLTGLFARIIHHIPRSLASAMLAGIVFHFGLNAFIAMQDQFVLVSSMFIIYLVGKRFFSRYVILTVLIFGIVIAKAEGLLHLADVNLSLSHLAFVRPQWDWAAVLSLGLPLFIVTMTSQNIPGVTVLNAAGYKPPLSPIMSTLGFCNVLIAPFGGFALSLAAITAGICLSPEAEPDPGKRYTAAVVSGFVYFVQGIFGATLVALFTAFPKELTFAIAGLSLLSTLTQSIQTAMANEHEREPAMICFLVAASGVSIFGLSAALWALLAGTIALLIYKPARKPLALPA